MRFEVSAHLGGINPQTPIWLFAKTMRLEAIVFNQLVLHFADLGRTWQ